MLLSNNWGWSDIFSLKTANAVKCKYDVLVSYSATLKCYVMLPIKLLLTVLIWTFKRFPFSAQTNLGMKHDQITMKYESSEMLFYTNLKQPREFKDKGTSADAVSKTLKPFVPPWSCFMNQLSCHRVVSRAWLSTAWDLSTNINIPSCQVTTKLNTETNHLPLENQREAIRKLILTSKLPRPWKSDKWQLIHTITAADWRWKLNAETWKTYTIRKALQLDVHQYSHNKWEKT